MLPGRSPQLLPLSALSVNICSARSLDLGPFTTVELMRARCGMRGREAPNAVAGSNGTQQADQPGGGGGSSSNAMYHLFGVVSHHGDIQGGHYVSYVKCAGRWYQCDDAWISLVHPEVGPPGLWWCVCGGGGGVHSQWGSGCLMFLWGRARAAR